MNSNYDTICADIDSEFVRFCLLYDKYLDRYTEMGNLIRDVSFFLIKSDFTFFILFLKGTL